MAEEEPVHIVAFPFPLQGHIAPTLHLVHSLLGRAKVIVSFVTSDSHAKSLLDSKAEWYWKGIHGDSELRIFGLPDSDEQRSSGEWISDRGEWLGGMKAVFSSVFANMKMEAPLRALLRQLQEDNRTPRVSCIISDVSSWWVQAAAAEFGIPTAAIWTASASFLASSLHVKVLMEKGYIPLKGGESNKQTVDIGVPGLDGTQVTNLPSNLHTANPADPDFSLSIAVMSKVAEAKVLLVNSCDQLEGELLGHLQGLLKPKLLAVGPLISVPLDSGGSEAGFWKPNSECLDWLDEKADGSVIYISFGSMSDFSFEEIQSIAEGVESSRQAFLWVLRRNLVSEVAPGSFSDFFSGFISRTEQRGLVISWSPQAQVLCHRAVGGFITHCGWNSCLEAVLAGVPMLTLPRFVDQNVNAKLVCDDWKIGKRLVDLVPGEGTVTGSDVASGIRCLMESGDMRSRARSMKSAVEEAYDNSEKLSLLELLHPSS